jgi:hypothetical protein
MDNQDKDVGDVIVTAHSNYLVSIEKVAQLDCKDLQDVEFM